jgi:hypothetical protein
MFGQWWAPCPGAARCVVLVREGVLEVFELELLDVEPLAPAATVPPVAIAPTITATAANRLRVDIGNSFVEVDMGGGPPPMRPLVREKAARET